MAKSKSEERREAELKKANDAADNEDQTLGSVQEPQSPSGRDLEETNDTPVSDEEKADAAEAPADPDDQEVNNPRHSDQPGEAGGKMLPEEKAAEKHPDSAKHTNPVGEATQYESKDPYATGHTIKNPEPNNGLGEDAEKGKAKLDEEEAEAARESDETAEQTFEEASDSGANE